MSAHTRRVIRNSIFGLSSEAIGGALSFVIIIIIARFLGTSQFGIFSYILAFVGVFQLIADFGLTNIIVREISRARGNTADIVGAVTPLVWIFSLLTYAAIGVLSFLFSPDEAVLLATLVMGGAVLATFQAVVYGSVCRAHEEMGFNALVFVSHKFALLALVWVALSGGHGIVGVALAYLAANTFQWGAFYWVVRVRYLDRIEWRFNAAYWKHLVTEALPVGLAMVFRRATLHAGTLLLTAMSTHTAVGLFNAAYKIVQMVDMIPFTLSIPLFPPFSRLAKESPEKLYEALNRALRIFMLVAIPTFTLMLWLAAHIVELTFGSDYQQATSTLRVLSAALLFLFPTSLYIYVFTAMDKQKYYTLSSGICLGINVALALLLIPRYHHLGAAIATLAAEVAFFISGYVLLRKLGFRSSTLELICKPALAAGIACGALMPALRSDSIVMLFVATAGYGVVYFVVLMLIGSLRREDLAQVLEAVKPRQGTW